MVNGYDLPLQLNVSENLNLNEIFSFNKDRMIHPTGVLKTSTLIYDKSGKEVTSNWLEVFRTSGEFKEYSFFAIEAKDMAKVIIIDSLKD